MRRGHQVARVTRGAVASLAAAALIACGGGQSTGDGAGGPGMPAGMAGGQGSMSMMDMMNLDKESMPHDVDVTAHIRQEPGHVVYWVLPGPRRLSPEVFGTPDHPLRTAEVPQDAMPPIQELLRDLPILIGVPVMARELSDDGSAYTQTTMPTPFGDMGVPVSGSVDITFMDRRLADDDMAPPPMTPDDVQASIEFTDPAGNTYQLIPMLVTQPPIPGYETGGGVLLGGYHHGNTGTGSPLMPRVYTYAAFWAAGNVMVNGELADEMKMMHCMTTETVRDGEYALALDGELPLALDNTIAGQRHHTHCIVLPITLTPNGPVHEPVHSAFELPNGMMQPFIHIMFEQDEIVSGPPWNGPN